MTNKNTDSFNDVTFYTYAGQAFVAFILLVFVAIEHMCFTEEEVRVQIDSIHLPVFVDKLLVILVGVSFIYGFCSVCGSIIGFLYWGIKKLFYHIKNKMK